MSNLEAPPSNNFGFDSDIEYDSVDMPNSDLANKSNSDADVPDSNGTNINPWEVGSLKQFLHYHISLL